MKGKERLAFSVYTIIIEDSKRLNRLTISPTMGRKEGFTMASKEIKRAESRAERRAESRRKAEQYANRRAETQKELQTIRKAEQTAKQTAEQTAEQITKQIEEQKNAFLTEQKRIVWTKKELELESRLLEEISMTSDMQMTPPLWQKVKRNSKALDESESGE